MKTQGIAIRSQLNQALSMLDEKLRSIQLASSGAFTTTGQFSYTPNGQNRIDIKSSTDVAELINIYAFLAAKSADYEASAKALELTFFPPFTWLGYAFKDWAHDLKMRVTTVSSHNEVEELKKKKAILSKYLSEEDQLANTLKEMGFPTIEDIPAE